MIERLIIEGDPRTKKNSMTIAGAGRRCPRCGKFEKEWIRQGSVHDAWKAAALWQLRPKAPREPISSPVEIRCLFFMKTRRRVDLLNLLAAVDDLLVEAGILADDNSQIVVSHDGSRVLYDPKAPRVEINIEEMVE